MSNYVNIHSHSYSTNSNEITILNYNKPQYPFSPLDLCSVGIHPWFIDTTNTQEQLNILEKNIKNKFAIALGECGLDRLAQTDLKIQNEVFKTQLVLAKKHNKPVIIHCVKAFDELINTIQENEFRGYVIIHGFNNNEQTLNKLLDQNYYISLGNAIHNSESNASKLINKIPSHKLFLETDDKKISIADVYKQAALLKNCSIVQLKEQLYLNFKTVFNYE